MTEYEYRPMSRVNGGQWQPIRTGRGGGRAYQTIGAARGVLSREKRQDRRQAESIRRVAAYRNEEPQVPIIEYKVQRRPLGEWEDVD